MSIPSLCKSISSTLSRNLYIASSREQRHALATETLDEMGKRLFPELDRLLGEKGEASDDYRQAREAVLELLTFVTIHFVRNCSDFRRGIQFLEELADRSGHSQVKKKLVIYSNQLKKRWNETEPNVVALNPRAKRVRRRVNVSPDLAMPLGSFLFLQVHSISLPTSIWHPWSSPAGTSPGRYPLRRFKPKARTMAHSHHKTFLPSNRLRRRLTRRSGLRGVSVHTLMNTGSFIWSITWKRFHGSIGTV